MDEDTLDELGYHLAIVGPTDRCDLFLAMVAEYPDHARELADLLADLTIDDLRLVDDIEPVVAEDDPAVRHAMARFTAALQQQLPADPDPCPIPDASSRGSMPQ